MHFWLFPASSCHQHLQQQAGPIISPEVPLLQAPHSLTRLYAHRDPPDNQATAAMCVPATVRQQGDLIYNNCHLSVTGMFLSLHPHPVSCFPTHSLPLDKTASFPTPSPINGCTGNTSKGRRSTQQLMSATQTAHTRPTAAGRGAALTQIPAHSRHTATHSVHWHQSHPCLPGRSTPSAPSE